MWKYGFPDDSRLDAPLDFFADSELLSMLTLADRVVNLDTLLGFLGAALNLEYLALLDSVPHTFDESTRSVVTLHALREFHCFRATCSTTSSAQSSSSSTS